MSHKHDSIQREIEQTLRDLKKMASRPILFRRSRVTSSKRRPRIMKRRAKTMIDNGEVPMQAVHKEVFLGASDVTDFMTSNLMNERNSQMRETFHTHFGIYATKKEWLDYFSELQNLRCIQIRGDSGYFFDDENLSYMFYQVHSTHTSIDLHGDDTFIAELHNQFKEDFEFVTNQIEWMYSGDGNSIEIPLKRDRMPVAEMYPWLEGRSLESYYEDFMASPASILLLIGPPGTGKTTFIRGMLQHTESSATVSYDAAVLEKDYVFASFIEGDKSLLILEDADMFLKSRKEGNTMMHKFLNVGDGLVTTKGKKLVFSTNLPSIKDIDPALVRPGRCYDIVHFNELTQTEAEALAAKTGATLNGKRESWSIADVFFNENTNNRDRVKSTESKMGFV